MLAEHRLKPVAVLLTHGHIDHTFSVAPVCAGTTCRRGSTPRTGRCCRPDGGRCRARRRVLRRPAGAARAARRPQLDDGRRWSWPGSAARSTTRPAHPGVGAFRTATDEIAEVMFSGDMLFAGSIGRTDLPGGDHAEDAAQPARQAADRCDDQRGAARPRPDHDDRPGAGRPTRSCRASTAGPARGRRLGPTTARRRTRDRAGRSTLRRPQGHPASTAARTPPRFARSARRSPRRAIGPATGYIELPVFEDTGAVRARRRRVDRRRQQGDVHLRRPRRPVGHAAPGGHRRRDARGDRARAGPRPAAGQALVRRAVLPLRAPAGRPLPAAPAGRRRGDRGRRPGAGRRGDRGRPTRATARSGCPGSGWS